MTDTFEVFPDGEKWSYRVRSEDGKAGKQGKTFAGRADAIAAAKEARGDKQEELFRADGSPAATIESRGPEAIVLLRPDGSVYGELSHAVRAGGKPQVVAITPAVENTKAVS
jgi:hypothetical protein